MQPNTKKTLTRLIERLQSMLTLIEDAAEQILQEVIEVKEKSEGRIGGIIGDLTKLTQLLDKQYQLIKQIEKDQQQPKSQHYRKPDPATLEVVRKYLNKNKK